MSIPSPRRKLPVNPSVEHLQKQAKHRAKQNPPLQLTAAQHQLAQEYGCKNWDELTRMVETMAHGQDPKGDRRFDAMPKAARAGDFESIGQMLRDGVFTPHALDQTLAHLLWYGNESSWPARQAAADLLFEHGADPDGQYGSGGYGPIVFGTAECIQPSGLEWLIAHGADVTLPPDKTKYGNQCVMSHILGTYIRGSNAAKHRYLETLLAHGACIPSEVTPAMLAIHRGDGPGLAALIKSDLTLLSRTFPTMPYGNLELRGAGLMHCAVEFGENECVGELLQLGADINLPAEIIENIGGQTPVFHAIASNCDGTFGTLEYLAEARRDRIDLTVRATWRKYGNAQTQPMNPREYAEQAASTEDAKWRTKVAEEAALLSSFPR